MKQRWVVGAFILMSMGIACSLAVDLDPLKGDAGSGACEGANACRPAVPSGWQGPVFVRDGKEDVGCAAPFGSKVLGTLLDGVDASPGGCKCDCSPKPGSCQYRVDIFDSSTCSGSPITPTPFTSFNACAPNAVVPTFGVRYYDSGVTTSAGCNANAVRTGSSVAATESHLCLGAFPQSGCASGVCMPASAKACVAAEGDLACPAPFTVKRLFHRNYVDGVTCSPCACTFDPNACKSPPAIRITNAPCGSDAATTVATFTANAGCVGGTAEAGTGAISELTLNGCTTTTPSVADGSITTSDPITLCCAP